MDDSLKTRLRSSKSWSKYYSAALIAFLTKNNNMNDKDTAEWCARHADAAVIEEKKYGC